MVKIRLFILHPKSILQNKTKFITFNMGWFTSQMSGEKPCRFFSHGQCQIGNGKRTWWPRQLGLYSDYAGVKTSRIEVSSSPTHPHRYKTLLNRSAKSSDESLIFCFSMLKLLQGLFMLDKEIANLANSKTKKKSNMMKI